MNIFAVSPRPIDCAIALDDRRLGKMLLESTQMMATAMHANGWCLEALPRTMYDQPYKPVHQNHPCTKWAGQSIANFRWLMWLASDLAYEYHNRFGKHHACEHEANRAFAGIIRAFGDTFKAAYPEEAPDLTPFPDCTGLPPDLYPSDIHARYKECLLRKWNKDVPRPTWTRRGAPEWSNG